MIAPNAAMERILRIVIGVFFVCTVLSPLSSSDFSDLGDTWQLNLQQQDVLYENFEQATDEIFTISASKSIQQLTEKKLENMGINNALVSVYITDQTNHRLCPEDIVVEVGLDNQYVNRHDEICRYLEYELGTTIRIGYQKTGDST